ncbi:hypothetical protein OKW38_002758 [Paraburkholderia sp. MM5496-R1]|uniref:hypothetical protein n=1 Tax=Paraburkholderia sp. MM5496-R1 TaxID=2991065 RepID=UPI003D19601A
MDIFRKLLLYTPDNLTLPEETSVPRAIWAIVLQHQNQIHSQHRETYVIYMPENEDITKNPIWIITEFDRLAENLFCHFDYIDLETNALAQRMLDLGPRFKSLMENDKSFGHLMDYGQYDDDHVLNCPHCRELREAARLVVDIKGARAAARRKVSALGERWGHPLFTRGSVVKSPYRVGGAPLYGLESESDDGSHS